MNRLVLIFNILLFGFIAIHGQQTAEFAEKIRTENNIPEISYAVVTDNSILEIAALGQHSSELKDKASLNDRFHIGSNTKAMTGFLIAKYVELGKLKWDTKFFDLFPEWKKDCKPDYYGVTLQDLLSHRAKIQPFQGEEEKVPELKGTKQKQREAFGKYALTLPIAEAPENAKFLYSNAGYTLAALMLEKATGKTWEQLIVKVFNNDLKLNVKFSFPENQKRKDTWGHSEVDGKLIPVPSNKAPQLDFTQPAGDLNMKITDYLKFIQLNLQGLSGKDNYLKAETYKFIHKGIEAYSIGWYNIYENEQELSTHSGTVFTYFTNVHLDRKGRIGYIIFTNSFNEKTTIGVRLLMRKLKENYSRKNQ